MKSYVPMEQTQLLQTQLRETKLQLFEMTSINFIKELCPLDTQSLGIKSLIGFIYDKQLHSNTKNSIVSDSSTKLYNYAKEKSEKILKSCMVNKYLIDLIKPHEKVEEVLQTERVETQIE